MREADDALGLGDHAGGGCAVDEVADRVRGKVAELREEVDLDSG